jgi:hypothetical protein
MFIFPQTVLEEYGAVIYADVTTRFKDTALKFFRARGQNDLLVWPVPESFTSVVAYTNKVTFKSLDEPRCLFGDTELINSEVQSLLFLWFTREIILLLVCQIRILFTFYSTARYIFYKVV